MIRITYLDSQGLPAPTITGLESQPEELKIGRDSKKCVPGVAFGDQHDIVGRVHCTLKLVNDRYRLQLDPDNPVFVDGQLGYDDQVLDKDDVTLQIGTGGPKLRVVMRREGVGTSLDKRKTVTQGDLTRRIKHGAMVGGAALLLLGTATWYMREGLETTAQKMRAMDLASPNRLREALSEGAKSVYLVLKKDEAGRTDTIGTAWVVGDGVLATNAHVAVLFDEKEPGSSLIVRSNSQLGDGTRDHAVSRVLIHPGYTQFESMTATLSPKRITFGGAPEDMQFVSQADVALMWVESAEGLATPLKIASADSLLALRSGDPVGSIGFPMELMVGGGANAADPTPTMQVGNVTGVTDPFLGRSGSANATLVQHNLPATGGASGSPIMNGDGAVVALLNAGNVLWLDGGRLPLAVGVNFGQRADLLRELLDATYNLAQPLRTAAWAQAIRKFEVSEPKAVFEDIFKSFVNDSVTRVEIVQEGGGTLDSNREYQQRFTAPSAGYFLIGALAVDLDDINLEVLNSDGKVIGKDAEPDSYPLAELEMAAGETVVLRITGVEPGVGFNLRIVAAAPVSFVNQLAGWQQKVEPARVFDLFDETGTLATDQALEAIAYSRTVSIPDVGWYVFAAEASNGEDVDIVVLDEAGSLLAADQNLDDLPIAAIQLASAKVLKVVVVGSTAGAVVRLAAKGATGGSCASRDDLEVTVFTDDQERGKRMAENLAKAGFKLPKVEGEPNGDDVSVVWGCAALELAEELQRLVGTESGTPPVPILGFAPNDHAVHINFFVGDAEE